MAGLSLYRDQVLVADANMLSANLVTTLTPFRPLNDTMTWAFIADDAVMKKVSPAVIYNWGIAAPTVQAVLGGAPAGSLSGN